MKTMKIQCDYCGTSFERKEAEVKRSRKKGRNSYCSRTCHAKANYPKSIQGKGTTEHLKGFSVADEFTGFRYYLRKAKSRNREYDIGLCDIKEQWERQQGKCAYTGLEMKLYKEGENHVFTMASLDRVDSTKGYMRGNIQFVISGINLMKSNATHEETVSFLQQLRG